VLSHRARGRRVGWPRAFWATAKAKTGKRLKERTMGRRRVSIGKINQKGKEGKIDWEKSEERTIKDQRKDEGSPPSRRVSMGNVHLHVPKA